MDMTRFRRHLSPAVSDDAESTGTRISEKKPGVNVARLLCISIVCFLVLPALVTLSYNALSQDSPSGHYQIPEPLQNVDNMQMAEDRAGGHNEETELEEDPKEEDQVPEVDKQGHLDHENGSINDREVIEEHENGTSMRHGSQGSSQNDSENEDPLLGGLLADDFNTDGCTSRHQVYRYRKTSKYKPSAYLIERLRKYEALHRRCGPNTAMFNKSLNHLKSGENPGHADCQYIVWISYSGLGNKMVTIASTFLYALLTNRVLLIDKGTDMTDLFCESFPNTSWFLPSDFPMMWLKHCNETSTQRYGHLLSNNIIQVYENGSQSSLPHFVYVHLTHNYNFHDKLFFCEREQRFLEQIPWLLLKSNNYFVPSLYFLSPFSEELHLLFPDKDSVFHHLGRYLFHPSNAVWGLITRFFQAYLAYAEQRIGIQIRTFDSSSQTFSYVSEQVLACALENKVLPNVSVNEETHEDTYENRDVKKPIVVLVTSLSSGYFEKIRSMYWEHPTVDGQLVSVYQPSHEEWQQTEKQSHNMKAWAEMYLLSFSDVLITSPWSTFGYVAQGLGGIKPWIMFKPENETAPDPPCRQAMSEEPCFHAPPFYDCQAQKGIDTGKIYPYVRHCEDVPWGLKLVGNNEL
eukprot:Gb_39391 [translate_table: standard]